MYIDNSSKKDHEQEALDEAMVLAKSNRDIPVDIKTKYAGNAFEKEKSTDRNGNARATKQVACFL